jgi:predicted N-acetyltransferase YhbS
VAGDPIAIRRLDRHEIGRVWEIDRREFVARIYRLADGALVLEPHDFDVPGWPPGEPEAFGPHLEAALDRGGAAFAAFDGETLVGVSVLDRKPIGEAGDALQLKFLHVSRDWRRRGLASRLFDLAAEEARRAGAGWLYISATRSENTVNWYRRRGCVLARRPDPDLFALEPVDIHLEYRL